MLDNVDGKVVEGTVMKSDVKLGEWVLLSNGVEGCSLGQVVDYSN